jgi:2-dehydro-3-deoxyphosphooctonate aldolase (KDO 8-P synthase)
LSEVSREVGCPILTDVHETDEVDAVSDVVDVIQIPAFLCRQTSLLVKAGSSGKMVNIKKGQFLSPQNMKHAIEKVEHGGGSRIAVTERGTFFGYGDLVVDMRSFTTMRCFGYPVIFDATHSTQRPGGLGTATGGNRELSGPLSRAAVAYGIDGLYLEVHPCPEEALSDAACQLDYESAKRVIVDAVNIHTLLKGTH